MMPFKLEERNMQIGLIRHCRNTHHIGIIQTWDDSIAYRFYTFEKSTNLDIPDYTLVIFCKSTNNKTATNVTPLDMLHIGHQYPTHLRENGYYYSDFSWENLNKIIPFADYEKDRLITVYIPETNNANKPAIIYEYTLSGKNKYIFEKYMEAKQITVKKLDYNYLSVYISEKKDYIKSLDINHIISQFKVMRIERIERRRGRDDHYYIDKFQTLPFDDHYLNYLLPTTTESISIDYNWCSGSDEDNSGVYILEDETNHKQFLALSQYSPEKHLAFLIDYEYQNNIDRKIKRINIII